MIDDFPCKIVEVKVVVNGKHGTAKALIVGIDVFNGKKYVLQKPGEFIIQVFKPRRHEYLVLNLLDSHCEYLDDKNQMKMLPVPETIYTKMKAEISNGQILTLRTLRCPSSTGEAPIEKIVGYTRSH